MIHGLFTKSFLLEFIRDFILFEEDKDIIKKIAAYHQFHLVRKAFRSTIEATHPENEGKIGVAWHTQGSGKSISMAFYAGKVITAPEMKNPTIVVVTDRNDLGQLFGTFSNATELLRETPKQAETRQSLRELLENRPSVRINFRFAYLYRVQNRYIKGTKRCEKHKLTMKKTESGEKEKPVFQGFSFCY